MEMLNNKLETEKDAEKVYQLERDVLWKCKRKICLFKSL
jgi:hypothetical protein